MKKFLAFLFTAVLCVTCAAFAACKEEEDTVSVDEITITAPASTEIKAGDKFSLEYTVLPAEVAESAKVEWEISDRTKLSYANGEFTALTCGNVTVTARVKGNEVYDKIDLKVIAPEGYKEFKGNGYSLVYHTLWNHTTVAGIDTWTSPYYEDGTTASMNVTTETLNEAYFKAPASFFQSTYEISFGLMGYTVTFDEPVTVEKSTYLGVERLQVNCLYSLTVSGVSTSIHQTQLIFNNKEANLSCVLTVTYGATHFTDSAAKLQETVFSQFMPA